MKQGRVVDNRFRIETRIGAGGMAIVYRAEDLKTHVPVALKIMNTDAPNAFDRFEREARALADLEHPNIVRHVAHNMIDPQTAYLAVELLEGEDLRKRLRHAELTVTESLAIAYQVASALGAVHAKGMVHRDVKPGNVFLVNGDPYHVKLLDFGIAFLSDATHAVTVPGAILGTPGYVAPEVARSADVVDARADVFSLGSLLFRCLAGQPAFDGQDMVAVLAKLIFEETPRLKAVRPDIADSIDALVYRMMAKARDDRPANGAAVVQALDALGVLTGKAPEAPTMHDGTDRGSVPPPAPAGVSMSEPTGATWALTSEERVLCCVIIIEGQSEHPNPPNLLGLLQRTVAPLGAEIAELSNGSIVMTLSGRGGAIIDQAAKAARCALAARALMPENEMVLATGRRRATKRAPLGDLIDRAAAILRSAGRMKSMNRNGQDGPERSPARIRLDAMSAGLLGPSFEVGGDSLSLFLESERHPREASVRTLLGKATPCVGRERELAVLNGLWEECIGEPVARAALVTAAAGLGKSRLRYEFLQRVLGSDASVATDVWVARGDPMGAGSAFRILGQLVRQAMGILDGETAEVRRQKLVARVSRHFRTSDRTRMTEFLGELCGTPMVERESSARRSASINSTILGDQYRCAWEELLTAVTLDNPVLLVIEDLQWGDNPSLQIIDATLRNLAERPVMVLGLGRPEVHELFPHLWLDRGVQEIRLQELTRKAAEKLVRDVLGQSVAPDIVTTIVARAGGNAFFLEEMIRVFAEGRGAALPGTVVAVVQDGLERLPSDARRFLRAASVFGQVFWLGGVQSLLGGAAGSQRSATVLDELLRSEVITERRTSRFQGQREFIFRHAFVRDAAYAMLTEEDARLGHRLAGFWLESVGEVDAAVMAEQFERGEERPRAAWWYGHAASQALAGNDFPAVLSGVERGLALQPERLVAGELWRARAEAHRWLGDNTEAEKAGIEAMRLLEKGSGSWFSTAAELATVSARTGQHERLLAIVKEIGEVQGQPEPNAQVMARAKIAIQLLHAGHLREADDLLESTERLLQTMRTCEPWAVAPVHQARAIRAMFEGDVGVFLQQLQRAARLFEEAGDLRSAWTQQANVAYAYMEIGAYAEANTILQDAATFADRMGLKDLSAGARHNLGMTLARLGRMEEARSMERLALRVAVSLKNRRLESGCRTYLAMILFLSGDLEGAAREARAAVDMLSVAPPMRAHALGILGRVLVQAGKPEEALAATSEAISLMQGASGIEEGESVITLGHAEALGALGRTEAQCQVLAYAASRLQERATHIGEAAFREGFLFRVPENARVLELASGIGLQ